MACHGPLGRGDGYVLFTPPVADLTSEHVQKKLDAEIFRSIHQGRPNTAMGSWRLALSEEEILAVAQYVRQLGKNAGTVP
jgi:mono/diheme cytochrome c family protein